MSLSCRTAIVAVVAAAVLPATPAAATTGAQLRAELTRQSAKLGSASGQYVLDLTDDRVLWSKRPDTALVPASNEKLFTTATTLRTLGATAKLTTTVVAGEPQADPSTVDGDLYLVGSGDPTLGTDDLTRLADQLVTNGLRKVKGAVAGDESVFDTKRGGPSTGYGPDYNLGGRLGGLVIAHGAYDTLGPAHYAAAKLQELLKARGVKLGKAAKVATAPAGASEPLALVESAPISTLIAQTNQPSDNFYAEMLLKVIGANVGTGGTTTAGAIVARDELAPLDVKPTISDGSGLSHANKTTSRMVVLLLEDMAARDDFAAWRSSLAVAGKSGTLAKRMRGTAASGRCRAKTGTLSGVSALSGYCTAAGGDTIAFSFLENGVPYTAKAVEDTMAVALARYTG